MAGPLLEEQLTRCASWPRRFPPEQWSIYKQVMHQARQQNLRFAVGGGLAAMTYAGQWRNSKDIDLYVLPGDRHQMIALVTALGLEDYYPKQAYDRQWIYRSHKDDTIVDIMWAMANQRAQVDEAWLNGPEVNTGDAFFRLLPAEEELWSKLYVLQHDRCDWPDAANLLYGVGPQLDWRHLISRVAEDRPLLGGFLSLFAWLDPARARELPAWIWRELQLPTPTGGHPEIAAGRARLLDSRPWFTPALDKKEGEVTPC
jgi:hypothetical protein